MRIRRHIRVGWLKPHLTFGKGVWTARQTIDVSHEEWPFKASHKNSKTAFLMLERKQIRHKAALEEFGNKLTFSMVQ